MLYLSVALAATLVVVALFARRARRLLHQTTTQLDLRTNDLEQSQTELAEAIDRARGAERRALDAEKLADSYQIRLSTLDDELGATRADLEDVNAEVEEADRLAEHQSAELASLAIETEELSTQLADALKRAEANRQPTGATGDAATLWRLELARSERSWRYSVAVYPDDPSPFTEATDLLRLAVETEASALRDEVGAFLTVDWDVKPIEDPAQAHLVLRVAQELLAKAARIEEPAVLRVSEHAAGLVLAIEPSEEGDEITLDLREFDEDQFGASGLLALGANGDSSVTVNLIG